MRIAIVYDWMDKQGGVERLLPVLRQMYPDAEFFTSFYDEGRAPWARGLNVKTTFMQRLPTVIWRSRLLSLPFFPFAFESLNFRGYDLVISVTSAFAKSVITHPGTKHICILLTPPRYLWSHVEEYMPSKAKRALTGPYLAQLRAYDYVAARRPDMILSISRLVANRCKKFYSLDSEVVYPPFDEEHWKKAKENSSKVMILPETYYLVVARLEPYKRVELAIQACNKLRAHLIVVGAGSQKERLHSLAGPTIRFLENVTDEDLVNLYSKAQALIMPQEEDFGYTSLEAQFCGCPVITYADSGASETIIEGKTGLTYRDRSASGLQDAIEQFVPLAYNMRQETAAKGPRHVAAFSVSRFRTHLLRIAAGTL